MRSLSHHDSWRYEYHQPSHPEPSHHDLSHHERCTRAWDLRWWKMICNNKDIDAWEGFPSSQEFPSSPEFLLSQEYFPRRKNLPRRKNFFCRRKNYDVIPSMVLKSFCQMKWSVWFTKAALGCGLCVMLTVAMDNSSLLPSLYDIAKLPSSPQQEASAIDPWISPLIPCIRPPGLSWPLLSVLRWNVFEEVS